MLYGYSLVSTAHLSSPTSLVSCPFNIISSPVPNNNTYMYIVGMNAPPMSSHMGHPGVQPYSPGMSTMSAGRVYPTDQPMIFNQSNPHAPPIYPCGSCHKEVSDSDQAILCESGCNFWFHRQCTGLTEQAFQLLTKEVYAEWVCDQCLRKKNIPLIKLKP